MGEKPKARGRKTKEQRKVLEKKIVTAAKTGTATQQEIASVTGTSRQFVSKVLKEFNINLEELRVYKDRADDIWADKERMIMQHITPEKAKKASLQSLITSAAICKDKRSPAHNFQPAGFTSLVLNVDKLYMERSGNVASPVEVVDITPINKGESTPDPLPLDQASTPTAPDLDAPRPDVAHPDPGGAPPGMPVSGADLLYIPPVSDPPKQKRSRRKK